jgi:hypothetical protein
LFGDRKRSSVETDYIFVDGAADLAFCQKIYGRVENAYSLCSRAIGVGRSKRDVEGLVQILRCETRLVYARIEEHIGRTGIDQECKVNSCADGEVPEPEPLMSLSECKYGTKNGFTS